MHRITINYDDIDEALLFQGKKGRKLDLILFENRKESPYGDTHFVVQGVTKEQREKGVKGPILGNATLDDGQPKQGGYQRDRPLPQRPSKAPPRPPQEAEFNPLDEDEPPF